MNRLHKILVVLAVFLCADYAISDTAPSSLPPSPPPSPAIQKPTKVKNPDNTILANSARSHRVETETSNDLKQVSKNTKIINTIDSMAELNSGKKSDIKAFLRTNYKTEYLPNEIFNKSNSHLHKPIYMSEIVQWAFAAVRDDKIDTLRVLLDNYNFLLTIKSNEGYGLLSYAVLHGRNEIVYMLIYRGANLNEKNIYNSEPINIAARTNNIAAVKLLLDNGASGQYKDNFGKSALDYAAMNQNNEMQDYIIEFGK